MAYQSNGMCSMSLPNQTGWNITEQQKKLGKRMAYLLRYGAEKEGLTVSEGGYVDLLELLKVPLMRRHKPYDVLKEVTESVTHAGSKRFEKKYVGNSIFVRAVYGRRMERNPNHDGTNIPRLLETCLTYVCDNLQEFDLAGFPDEFLLNAMIHKLRRNGRLTNKAFRVILGPTMEHLDLGAVYVTEATIKLIAQRCPNLRVLNFRESSYVLNDHYMELLLKHLSQLETVNLSGCRHLTDRSVHAMCKHCPNLMHLNLSHVPEVTQEAVLQLMDCCPKLQHLDIFDNQNISTEGREVLEEYIRQRDVYVVLSGLHLEPASNTNASKTLKLASVGNYW